MKKIGLLTCLFIFIFHSYSSAAVLGNIDEIIPSGFTGYGARQIALGGTGIMTMDGTALFYNPANLARIPRIEFNLGFYNKKFNAESDTKSTSSNSYGIVKDNQSTSRLSSAILTVPYPTYRGSLVFGVGMVRTYDFDRISNYLFNEDTVSYLTSFFDKGGINQWAGGFGVDISPRIAFGSSLYYMYGRHEQNFEESIYPSDPNPVMQLFEYRYSAVGIKFGLAMQIAPYLGLGLTADLPVSFNIELNESSNVDDPTYTEYDLKRPFIFSIGASSRIKRLSIYGDVDYIDWTQMAYEDNDTMERIYNDEFRFFYRDIFRLKMGSEYIFPSLGLSLRAGFFIDPLPYKKKYIDKDRKGFTAGFGFLVDEVMTIDFAFVHSAHTSYYEFVPADAPDNTPPSFTSYEDISSNKFYITGAYRF